MDFNKIISKALDAYLITSKSIEPIARTGGSDGAVYKIIADNDKKYCLKFMFRIITKKRINQW